MHMYVRISLLHDMQLNILNSLQIYVTILNRKLKFYKIRFGCFFLSFKDYFMIIMRSLTIGHMCSLEKLNFFGEICFNYLNNYTIFFNNNMGKVKQTFITDLCEINQYRYFKPGFSIKPCP